MEITNKEIAKMIYSRLKDKHPLYFENVRVNDIERLLNYYGKIVSIILKKGGFLTLPIWNNHMRNRCIRIAPREKNVLRLQQKKRKNMIRNMFETRATK